MALRPTTRATMSPCPAHRHTVHRHMAAEVATALAAPGPRASSLGCQCMGWEARRAALPALPAGSGPPILQPKSTDRCGLLESEDRLREPGCAHAQECAGGLQLHHVRVRPGALAAAAAPARAPALAPPPPSQRRDERCAFRTRRPARARATRSSATVRTRASCRLCRPTSSKRCARSPRARLSSSPLPASPPLLQFCPPLIFP